MKTRHQPLLNTKDLDATQIEEALNKGGRFVMYKYQISFIANSLSRFSPAILYFHEDELIKLRRKYNLRTLLFGPWVFPYGPVFVYDALKFNNKGGMDVTEDIRINLEHYQKEEQTVEIVNIHTQFNPWPKAHFKELKKALFDYCIQTEGVLEVYAGIYLNVDEYTEPPYWIGINTTDDFEYAEETFLELVYKRFRSHAGIDVFHKNENPELFEKIAEQGQPLVKKI